MGLHGTVPPRCRLQAADTESPSIEVEGIAESEPDISTPQEHNAAANKLQDTDREGEENGKRLEVEQPRSGQPEADKAEERAGEEIWQRQDVQREDSVPPVINREQANSPTVEDALDARTNQGGTEQQADPRTQLTLRPTYRVLFVVRMIDTDMPAATTATIRGTKEAPANSGIDARAAEIEVPPIEAKERQ